jgi:hypothetical protein
MNNWIRGVRRCWRRGACVVLACLALVTPSMAHAWGEKGHRITGLVAQALLTPHARARLKELVGDEDLATIALYMDRNRASLEERIPGSRKWHYDNLPVCDADTRTPAQLCPDDNCASAQLGAYTQVLSDPRAPLEQRRFAVYVLVHLVGDIHQPLHAGDHEDAGGNDVKVAIPGSSTPRLNLHGAWDVELIERLYGGQDERAVAARLIARYRKQFSVWDHGSTQDWLRESNQLARSLAYGALPGFACAAPTPTEPVTLTPEYLAAAGSVIPEQLARAGARIAQVLNRALGR